MVLLLVIPPALAVLGIGFLWHEQHDVSYILPRNLQHRTPGTDATSQLRSERAMASIAFRPLPNRAIDSR